MIWTILALALATKHICLVHHKTLVITKIKEDKLEIVLGGAMRTTIQEVKCPTFQCPTHFVETNKTWVTEKELPKILKGMK